MGDQTVALTKGAEADFGGGMPVESQKFVAVDALEGRVALWNVKERRFLTLEPNPNAKKTTTAAGKTITPELAKGTLKMGSNELPSDDGGDGMRFFAKDEGEGFISFFNPSIKKYLSVERATKEGRLLESSGEEQPCEGPKNMCRRVRQIPNSLKDFTRFKVRTNGDGQQYPGVNVRIHAGFDKGVKKPWQRFVQVTGDGRVVVGKDKLKVRLHGQGVRGKPKTGGWNWQFCYCPVRRTYTGPTHDMKFRSSTCSMQLDNAI